MMVAVTGAQGLIGTRLCAALAAAGHGVRRLTRNPAGPHDRKFVLGEDVGPNVLAGCDALVHGAYDFKALGWEEIHRVNVEGSMKLVAAAATAGVKRIVFVSTVSAFEDAVSNYGRGKILVEKMVLAGGGIVVRPGLVWGGDGGFYGTLEKACAAPLLPVFDGGRQPLQMVHIDDAVRDLISALTWDPKLAGGPVTSAHPEPVYFRTLLQKIGAGKGRTIRTFSIPSGLALFGLRFSEALGLPTGFRSDSLVSLLNTNRGYDWSPHKRLGLSYRPYP